MNKRENIRSFKPAQIKVQFPDIPRSLWCDFRIDYESGMTLTEIGEKYYCDPRTVKACIVHNKSSHDLGKHTVPVKIAPYQDEIDACIHQIPLPQNISALTRSILCRIRSRGYSGSERTLRNYIVNHLPKPEIKKEDNQSC